MILVENVMAFLKVSVTLIDIHHKSLNLNNNKKE